MKIIKIIKKTEYDLFFLKFLKIGQKSEKKWKMVFLRVFLAPSLKIYPLNMRYF